MNIIEIKKQHIHSASIVLAEAFQEDPIFRYIFKTQAQYDRGAAWLFSTWIRWAIKYGKAWMTEDGNGIVLMRSLESPNMTLRSMIGAGMLPTPFRLGWRSFFRFYFKIVSLLDRRHAAIMGKQPHWYGWMIGVKPGHQGIGRELMNHCFNLADQKQLPIFLETSTARNVSLYGHKEFRLHEKLTFTPGDFNLYFMVRPPQPITNGYTTQVRHSSL
jgi:ribosomal protein S18 acetylase RimI-like enzyme